MAVFGNAGQDCCARSRIVVEQSIYDDFVAAFAPADRAHPGRRSARREHRDGTDDLPGPAPGVARLPRDRRRRRRRAGHGWRDPDRPGPGRRLLPHARGARRRRQRHARRPRGDLRPGRVRHPVRRRSRRDPHRQRQRLRPLRLAVDPRPRAARSASAKAIRTGVLSVNSNRSVRTEAPFGGYKRSGLGRELGMHAMQHYTEVKNLFLSSE